MNITDVHIGQWVVYRPYPGAPAEDGEVVGIRGTMVMVRYGWSSTSVKATPPDLLTPGNPT